MSLRTDQVQVVNVPWWRRTRTEANIAFILFVAPMVIGLTIFTFIPIVWGTLISFSEARNTISIGDWVGFDNYRAMLSNPEFRRSLRTIITFSIFIVPLTFFFSLLLALLVNSAGFGKPIFRTIFFIPTAISYVIASIIWKMGIFNGGAFGLANMIWYKIDENAPVVAWIGTSDPPYYWLVLVSVRLWLQVGFYMILFIAALQEIDSSLYEAAQVDGARLGWHTFWTITFPLLRNTSIAVLMLNFIAAFQAFDEFINILGGVGSVGNISLARPPLVYLYQVAIQQQDYGRGSAGAIILAVIIIAITVIQGRLFGFGEASMSDDQTPPTTGSAQWDHIEYPRKSRADVFGWLFIALRYGLLLLLAFIFLIPFYIMIRNALMTQPEITDMNAWRWWPEETQWGNFNRVFEDTSISMATGLRVSTILALVNLVFQTLFASMAGYALARVPFRGRDVVFFIILLTLMIPSAVTFVPTYVVVSELGGINTLWGIVVPGLFSAFATFLFRQFYLDFPTEIEEAGRLDGNSYFGVYWKLLLPNSLGIMAALGVLSFIYSWNAFLWPVIVGQSPETRTVQVVLSSYLTAQTIDLTRLFAGAIIGAAPLIVVFLLLQRYIVQGVRMSGIKG